jgi:hypothetical protein
MPTETDKTQTEVQETTAEEPTFAPPAPRRIRVNKSCTCA